MTYTIEMRDETGTRETTTIDADTNDEACKQASSKTAEWIEGGEWGDEGASIRAYWTLSDASGDPVGEDAIEVDIEPNHEALIRNAGGKPDCEDGEGHDWSSEGEGGCDENPGVWSTGGTSFLFRSHCTKCGLQRRETTTGSQRNPGEHDTVEYMLPDSDEDSE